MANNLVGKFQTAIWFLQRPRLYPQALQLARNRLAPAPGEKTRAQAIEWCRSRAISSDEAIERITGAPKEQPVEQKYAALFAEAQARVAASPFVMGGAGALDLLY